MNVNNTRSVAGYMELVFSLSYCVVKLETVLEVISVREFLFCEDTVDILIECKFSYRYHMTKFYTCIKWRPSMTAACSISNCQSS